MKLFDTRTKRGIFLFLVYNLLMISMYVIGSAYSISFMSGVSMGFMLVETASVITAATLVALNWFNSGEFKNPLQIWLGD